MSIPLTYAFNQRQLEKLINLPGAEKIVFSLCNLKNPVTKETYLYLCANAFDAKDLVVRASVKRTGAAAASDESLDGAVGCPTPPGWGPNVPPPPPEELGLAPQFFVSVGELNGILTRNKLVIDTTPEIHVEIVGGLEEDGLEAKLNIYSKDADNAATGAIVAESFTSLV